MASKGELRKEWCTRIVDNPLRSEPQEGNRYRFWAEVAELKGRYLRVTDNAFIESFFHSMKSEIVHGLSFAQDDEIESAVRDYIPFYNDSRLHSSLNYVPPATYEQLA